MSGANRHASRGLMIIKQAVAIIVIATLFAILVNALRPGKLPWVADWSPAAHLTLDSGGSLEIPLEEAATLFFARAVLFLDARSPELYRAGHIEGAKNLPWEQFDEYFPRVMAGVSLETPIVAYCDGEGCGLSKELAMVLLGHGYNNVRVLVNGWVVWLENGLPTDAASASSQNSSAIKGGKGGYHDA